MARTACSFRVAPVASSSSPSPSSVVPSIVARGSRAGAGRRHILNRPCLSGASEPARFSRSTRSRLRAKEREREEAHLTAGSIYEVPVEYVGDGAEAPPEVSVDNYLRLPIEQYFIADPDAVTKISENMFVFQLPKLHFFNVWVAPAVTMSVQLDEEPKTKVNIQANECKVKGSKFIEKMKINDRLKIKVKTSLEQEQEKLKASSDLDIWCEIVPPFHLLPKSLLEKTCNAVLRTTLKTLLKSFMNELSADYKLWSTDTTYREERAKRSLTKTV